MFLRLSFVAWQFITKLGLLISLSLSNFLLFFLYGKVLLTHLISGWLMTSHTATMLQSEGKLPPSHAWPVGLKFMHTAKSVDK